MTEWGDVANALKTHWEVLDEGDNFLAVTLRSGDRSQTVMITYHEGLRGPGWLRIESGVAAASAAAALAALDFVSRAENLPVGVGLLADVVVLRWTSFLEGLSAEQVAQMVEGLAGRADQLEAQLSVSDVF